MGMRITNAAANKAPDAHTKLGAAPSLVWASGALFAAAFVILIPIAVWIYTLVFIFSALWFVHFLLLALSKLREEPIIILNEAQP